MNRPFGASHEEWWQFDVELGLTADLLPVVSNPNATISPDSRMKGIGKTPSIYNRHGQVVGLTKWTEKITTGEEIERYSKERDYGFCVKTGAENKIYALDVDVPELRLQREITATFLARLAERVLPQRARTNSNKTLFAFRIAADLPKRSFRVPGGLVEFLGRGQQFVAVGTHPSGGRYVWVGGPPLAIPTITIEDFERAWEAIVGEFAIEPERRASERQAGTADEHGDGADDEVARWLEEHWETYGRRAGKLYVCCPFKDGHSSDSGETEAVWLLAGTRGFARGHFECLHAGCAGRTDREFLQAVAYRPTTPDDFNDLTIAPQAGQDAEAAQLAALYVHAARSLGRPLPKQSTGSKALARGEPVGGALPLPGFLRTKQGEIEAVLENVVRALAAPEACGVDLQYDTFRDELMISKPAQAQWVQFTDADAVELRMTLEGIGFKSVGKEMMRDALTAHAKRKQFDSATFWLEQVVPAWDGIERIAGFYPRYFKTKDTPYTRACGEYVWTAHAGRVLEPGVKADMVPVLVGPQGLRKSSGVAAIAPAEEFFAELDLEVKDNDLGRKMRGVLVGELAELRGLNTREAEAIRAWVVRRFEEWTPKYMERKQRFWRRLVLHGTTNDEEFLNDPTGERRWLPMTVDQQIDVDSIVADRLQLWAEARERFKRDGVLWQEAERLAKAEHAEFKSTDPWARRVALWLDEAELDGGTPRSSGHLRSEDVLMNCCGIDLSKIGKREQMRIGAVLRACGMQRVKRRPRPAQGSGNAVGNGLSLWVWEDANSDLA